MIRHLLILSPLATLLLASCEPDGDSASFRDRKNGEMERQDEELAGDKINRERIAAQDSVGKMPQPRDLVSRVEDSCPVHHEKMKLREIPIVFVESAPGGDGAAGTSASARYPFGAEKIITVGNALLPGEPLTARVYQCTRCIAASRAAAHRPTSAAAVATQE